MVGGAGFVGSNLVRAALARGRRAGRVVDNLLSASGEHSGDKRVDFVEGSIADDAVLGALTDEYDYIFHLATYHGNQSSIADPLADHENNLLTTLKLCEHMKGSTARKARLRRLGLHACRANRRRGRGDHRGRPVPLELDSPYQISKVVGEFYSVYYHRRHGLPTVRARFQNVYGPGEILGAGRWRGTPATVWRNVRSDLRLPGAQGLPLELDDGGAASRDFIYVGDIVRGLIRCASAARRETSTTWPAEARRRSWSWRHS